MSEIPLQLNSEGNISKAIRYEAAANSTISDRFKNLVSEKGRIAKAVIETQIQKARPVILGMLLGEMVVFGGGFMADTNLNLPPNSNFYFESAEIPQSSVSMELSKQLSALKYEYHGTGVEVAFDQDGMPAKYLSPDGKEVVFDKEKLKSLKEKAISSKEPEIITQISIPIVALDSKVTYSAEHPKISELPEDVLSEEELLKKGISILQPGSGSTHLDIRASAFEKDGPLADFNNTGKSLTIILLDGNVLDEKNLTDPKYADLMEKVPEEYRSVENYRKALVERQAKIVGDIVRLRTSNNGSSAITESAVLREKQLLYDYAKLFSDEQIRQTALLNTKGKKTAGFYIYSATSPAVILFGLKHFQPLQAETLFFDSKGNFLQAGRTLIFDNDNSPKPGQTYPNPANFPTENVPEGYLYGGGISPGFDLWHEIAHDKLIRQAEIPDFREDDTDAEAAKGVMMSYDKWEKSGRIDNSGYPFVFSLPKEQGGGYIVTLDSETQAIRVSKKT